MVCVLLVTVWWCYIFLFGAESFFFFGVQKAPFFFFFFLCSVQSRVNGPAGCDGKLDVKERKGEDKNDM